MCEKAPRVPAGSASKAIAARGEADVRGDPLYIEVGAEKHEVPAGLCPLADELADPAVVVLARRVLLAIGEDGDHDVGRASVSASR
jgi:hypothetical protein